MQLEQTDFQRLIGIVKGHPDFALARDRVRLLRRVFEGSERGRALITLIDPEGDPRGAATEVLAKTAGFGQLEFGRPALGIFLSSIQDDVGDDEALFIGELFTRYPLEAQPVRARPLPSWHEPPQDPTELIIGENTLLPIAVLEAGLAAARAVVRIRVDPSGSGGWVGTGFLVARNLVFTCNHVISNLDDLAAATCEFNYQLDRLGRELPVQSYRTNPDGKFQTDVTLDFSVFELTTAVPEDCATPLRFARKAAQEGQRIAIIQHPGGRPKQISLHQNKVTCADGDIVQYITSTEPGSSGSPVLDNTTFEVVAVHNKGGHLPTPGKHGVYLRNEGSSVKAILKRLKELAPDLHQQMAVGG